jgi:hypothetical protein
MPAEALVNRIATDIRAFESDSQVRIFQGNVGDYEAFRRKELGTAADQPHRIRLQAAGRLSRVTSYRSGRGSSRH